MKNLVVCCDGTWNTPDQTERGIPSPTNVVRIYNCLTEGSVDGDDVDEQLIYYHPGVGTEGGAFDQVFGGGFGAGIGKNIMSAYRWLGDVYKAGDRICLFGFSRGAYTVRCVTGLIKHCGLLATASMEATDAWDAVEKAYNAYLNRKRDPDAVWWNDDMRFHVARTDQDEQAAIENIPIYFLGVWDTVGALGIPDDLGVSNIFDRFDRYSFSDTKLCGNVVHARHAVAMDERRSNFAATLWHGEWRTDQDVKELWFPGSHADVGGGWAETHLSDGALKWMIEEAEETGLVFSKEMVDQIKPDPLGILHEATEGVMKHLNPVPRAVPLIKEESHFHDSAIKRHKTPPITQAPFWRTRKLTNVSDSVSVAVYAREPWNSTEVWLDKNHVYEFKATGNWLDKNVSCGPGGTRDGNFQIGEIGHVLGSWWGQAERLLKWSTDNEEVDLRGTRRHEDYPWFCLVGAVANDKNPDASGTPLRHEHFAIGRSCPRFSPARSGYLYAYANDAWHFYSNNRGSVFLTIERIE